MIWRMTQLKVNDLTVLCENLYCTSCKPYRVSENHGRHPKGVVCSLSGCPACFPPGRVKYMTQQDNVSDLLHRVKLTPDPEPQPNSLPGKYTVEYLRGGGVRSIDIEDVAHCLGAETGLVLKDKHGNVLAFFSWEVDPVAIRREPEDAVPGYTR